MKNPISVNRKIKLISFMLSAAVIIFAVSPAYPSPAENPQAAAAELVSQINAAYGIKNYAHGLYAALSAAGSGTVNVTGSVTDLSATYKLSISQGVTVNWNATFSGALNSYVLNLAGPGSFNIGSGGSITNAGQGGAITVTCAGAAVSVNGGAISSAGSAITLNIAAADVSVNITSGGSVVNTGSASAVSVGSNITGVVLNVGGGRITSVPSGYAINDGGAGGNIYTNDTRINITGGSTIEAGNASAIQSTGSKSVVTITDSTVTNSAPTNTNSTIYMNGGTGDGLPGGFNVIIGGTSVVSTTNVSNTSYVIQTTGNVLIKDSAKVSAMAGRAINLVGSGSTAVIEGGVVSATTGIAISTATTRPGDVPDAKVIVRGGWVYSETGTAIQTTGVNGSVTVTGGWVTATTGLAIKASARAEISGGFVFAYGSGASVANVVTSANSDFPTGDGIIAMWNNTLGNRTYFENWENDLTVFAAAPGVASWHNGGTSGGIRYSLGSNNNFFPLTDVIVQKDGMEDQGIFFVISDGLFRIGSATGAVYTGQSGEWQWTPGASGSPGTLRLGLGGGFNYATKAAAALTITGGSGLTVELHGGSTNVFVSSGTEPGAAGIKSAVADITITGGGVLNASASAGAGADFSGRSITVTGGATLNASAGSLNNNHGITANSLTIDGGTVNAVSGGPSTSGETYGVNVSYLTIAEGDGLLVSSGNARAVSNAGISLPGGYAFWRGSRADGSNAAALSYPGGEPYSYNAGNRRYVAIQARRSHKLSVSDGADVTARNGGYYFAGETVGIRTTAQIPGTVSPTMHPMYYPSEQQVFKSWKDDAGGIFADANAPVTSYEMPDREASVGVVFQTAYKMWVEGGYIYLGPNASTGYRLGYYLEGAEVPLGSYGSFASFNVFNGWDNEAGAGNVGFGYGNSLVTMFTMSAANAKVVAQPLYIPQQNRYYFSLTLVNAKTALGGDRGGSFQACSGISIVADAPPEGKEFYLWKIAEFTPEPPEGTDRAYEGGFGNITGSPTIFTMPQGNITIEALYRDVEYNVDVTNGEGSGTYTLGKQVSITAEPRTGQSFDGWTLRDAAPGGAILNAIIDNPASSAASFPMPAKNVTVTAGYRDDYYNLFITDDIPGGGSVTACGSFKYGESAPIYAAEIPGYIFTGWYVADSWVSAPESGEIVDVNSMSTSIIMPPNGVTVTAGYEPEMVNPVPSYLLTLVTTATTAWLCYYGESVEIDAAPEPGKRFSHWIAGGGGAFGNVLNSKTVFSMPARDVTVTAVYADDGYALTVVNGYGSGYYEKGRDIIISAYDKSDDGLVFYRWIVEGGDDGGLLSSPDDGVSALKMPDREVKITAVYLDDGVRYQLKVNTVIGGVKVPLTGMYKYKEHVAITADPRFAGQRFGGWTVEGGGILENPASGTTVFTMPANDAVLTAEYINFYVLTVVNGVIAETGSDTGRYNTGDIIKIKADDPQPGLKFENWTAGGNGTFTDGGASVTDFVMSGGDATVTATFGKIIKPDDKVEPDDGTKRDGGDTSAVRKKAETGFGGDRAQPDKTGGANVPDATDAVNRHNAFVRGVGDGLFAPDDNMSRAEAAQLFFNLLKGDNDETDASENDKTDASDKKKTALEFGDVSLEAWYAEAVGGIAQSGLIVGYPDGGYHPADNITRAEFISVVVRFAGSDSTRSSYGENLAGNGGENAGPAADGLNAVSGANRFPDVPAAHWAYGNIRAALDNGWIDGYEDGKFSPENYITRAEAVKILNRVLNRSPDKAYIDSRPETALFADVQKGHWAYYEIVEASFPHEYTLLDYSFEQWMFFLF